MIRPPLSFGGQIPQIPGLGSDRIFVIEMVPGGGNARNRGVWGLYSSEPDRE